jgi:SAM-dependent methyltransferase
VVNLPPEERFTNRADDYARFRPSYPSQLLDRLARAVPSGVVADVGAGTGIFSQLLSSRGYVVHAIEPNTAMSAKAAHHPNITWHSTLAESTGLADASVDLVTVAQAFHWFDKLQFRKECDRILRQGGQTALIWNVRETTTQVGKELERVIETFSSDRRSRKTEQDEVFDQFFGPGQFEKLIIRYDQLLDFETLLGRVFSSSYMPAPNSDNAQLVERALFEMFERRKVSGLISVPYSCEMYLGP